MSMLGRARVHGATFTRYRATNTLTANGTASKSWTDVGPLGAFPATMKPISSAMAQRIWGRESQASYVARLPAGFDVKIDDVLVGVTGPQVGTRFRCLSATPVREGPTHLACGFTDTPEAVP